MHSFYLSMFSIILYLVTTVLLSLRMRGVERFQEGSKNLLLLPGLIALLIHLFVLYQQVFTPTGINMGFYSSLSLVSAFITLFTITESARYPAEIVCMIMMPIAAAMLALDAANESTHMLPPDSSTALITHVMTSLLAYSVLGLAALYAILLSVQNATLHARQTGGILKLLPPLKTMETMLFESISVGFLLLSVSLATGLMFLENMFAQQLVHKTVLSMLAWMVFGILLCGRMIVGWRGKTAIRWTLGGFISLMLAYFGSKFVLEVILA